MAKKKLIITGVITIGLLSGIITCMQLTSNEKNVEAIAEVQTADEPEIEAEPEEVETASEEIEAEPEEVELSVEDELTDLYAGAIVETETAEEEEYIQSLAEGEEDIVNAEVEDMEAQMFATQNVNLRKGTAVTTESLRLVNFAEEVSVTGITTDKQWYRVQDGEQTGFIASNYLSETKPSQNTSTQQASASTSTESSGSTQSSGGSSGGGNNGVSQAERDQLNAALAQFGELRPSEGQTMEMAWEGNSNNISLLGE